MKLILTIQIVGWNSAHDLPTALNPLASLPADLAHIRYIDNASKDDSVAQVRQLLPRADIIELEENIGFAGGHNVGLAVCSTPFVLFHNPDLALRIESLSELLRVFSDPKVAAAQGLLYRDEPEKIIDSAGVFRTLALNGRERGAGEIDKGQFSHEASLLAVTGAAGMYRLAALRTMAHTSYVVKLKEGEQMEDVLEVLDRDFFAYKEDVDLGWRLRRARWRSVFVPVIEGTHARHVRESGRFGWRLSLLSVWRRLRDRRTHYSLRNWVWTIVKNVSVQELLVHALFIVLRGLSFLMLGLLYPPLWLVWLDIGRGLPKILKKRLDAVDSVG